MLQFGCSPPVIGLSPISPLYLNPKDQISLGFEGLNTQEQTVFLYKK
jgi:hypothetical protein